jgi:hypothetical protein
VNECTSFRNDHSSHTEQVVDLGPRFRIGALSTHRRSVAYVLTQRGSSFESRVTRRAAPLPTEHTNRAPISCCTLGAP